VASTKLAQDWSADRVVRHVSPAFLGDVLADGRFGSYDTLMKVRLLLAGLLALDREQQRQARAATPAPNGGGASAAAARGEPTGQAGAAAGEARAELQAALRQLRAAVAADPDEWAKVMAAAAGPLDGRLHLDALMRQSPVVGGCGPRARVLSVGALPACAAAPAGSCVARCTGPHLSKHDT
jgi:hypothetical protein